MMGEDHLTQPKPVRTLPRPDIFWIAAIALVYFLVARFSLTLIFEPEGIAAIWPPAGIFLSAVLLTRRKIRPYLVGVLFLTDLTAEILAGIPLVVSLVYSAALAGDAALSAWLLLRFVGEPITFRRSRDVIGFLLLSVLLSNALASVAAALVVKAYHGAPFWSSWFWWWSSDGVGNLLVTPLIMSLAYTIKNHFKNIKINRVIEGAVLFLLMVFLNIYIFSRFPGDDRLVLLLNIITIPFLIWASLRLGVIGAVSTNLILAMTILWNTILRQLPLLGTASILGMIILVQLYLAMLSMSSLFLASLITERKQTEKRLEEEQILLRTVIDNLPDRVYAMDVQGCKIISNLADWQACGGKTMEDVIGKTDFDTYPPEMAEAYWALDKTVIDSGKSIINIEEPGRDSRGNPLYVLTSKVALRDREGKVVGLVGIGRDITELKRAEQALRENEVRFRSLYENALIGMYRTTPDGRVLMANPALVKLLGYQSFEELSQRDLTKDQFEAEQPRTDFQNLIHQEGHVSGRESAWKRKDGSTIFVRESARLVKDEKDQPLYYEGQVEDITERMLTQEELRRAKDTLETANRRLEQSLAREEALARKDSLTGLCNRLYFDELAAREFLAAVRYQRALAIMMIDVDDFKQINDTLGHAAGDEMLTLIAQTAAKNTRVTDVLARYGGDEFVLLLPETTAKQALSIADRIHDNLAQISFEKAKDHAAATLSIGIDELRREPMDQSVENMVRRADQALYEAKRQGRNRVVRFHAELAKEEK
jgi:diguanylate cyclase (GGDEF)-like protein/PAS domain S-box-containing protein